MSEQVLEAPPGARVERWTVLSGSFTGGARQSEVTSRLSLPFSGSSLLRL